MTGKPEEIIAAYEALVERAKRILEGVPYRQTFDDRPAWRLEIDGDTATLAWPVGESDYDGPCGVGEESVEFAACLLAFTDEDVAAWQKRVLAEERALAVREAAAHRQKCREDAKLREARREQEERELLAVLKAKYEESEDPER